MLFVDRALLFVFSGVASDSFAFAVNALQVGRLGFPPSARLFGFLLRSLSFFAGFLRSQLGILVKLLRRGQCLVGGFFPSLQVANFPLCRVHQGSGMMCPNLRLFKRHFRLRMCGRNSDAQRNQQAASCKLVTGFHVHS
ncbi:MAG: hypothetical protein WDZ63_07825 [Burkholderiales bacterium]